METGVLKAFGLRKSRHRIPLLLFAELVQLIDTGRFGFSPVLPGKLPGLRNAEHRGPSCLVMQPVSRLHPVVASVRFWHRIADEWWYNAAHPYSRLG